MSKLKDYSVTVSSRTGFISSLHQWTMRSRERQFSKYLIGLSLFSGLLVSKHKLERADMSTIHSQMTAGFFYPQDIDAEFCVFYIHYLKLCHHRSH
mmetsp:Transcript_10080/g.25212  ORF Transcript_10080/g.25212 Transcript_10080/m.25212 type:complete len:96 (+) Transcript_10080:4044-4331(+)